MLQVKSYKLKVIKRSLLRSFTHSLLFCFLLSAFCLVSLSSCDKEELLINRWRLQTVLMNGEPLNDSLQFNVIPKTTTYHFFFANSLNVTSFALGQWTSSSNGYYQFSTKSTFQMRFALQYKQYNITAKIKKLTRRELNLEYDDNGNTYFLELYAF